MMTLVDGRFTDFLFACQQNNPMAKQQEGKGRRKKDLHILKTQK